MKNVEPVIAKARAERRKFRRIRVNVPGKLFLPDTGVEIPCTVMDMSSGGAQVHCDASLQKGTRFVLYVDGFGRFEGTIVRLDGYGCGLHFASTALKRERTAEQLTLFANKGMVDTTTLRRHDRAPTKGLTRFTRHDGQIIPCEVLDLSLGGISLKTEVKPPIGEFVLIGQLAARVARHHAEGIGLQFVGVNFNNAESVRDQLSMSR